MPEGEYWVGIEGGLELEYVVLFIYTHYCSGVRSLPRFLGRPLFHRMTGLAKVNRRHFICPKNYQR